MITEPANPTPSTVPSDFATLGPVHLDVTNPEKSLKFWQDTVGLRLRSKSGSVLELGTERETLLVLHGGATSPVRRGHSGLYHVAIHLPNEIEFARVLARLIIRREPISPTDHVMSKAIYLNDPDGIGLELTLETPERQRSMSVTAAGIEIIDSEGRVRSGRDPLDVQALLAVLPDRDFNRPVPEGTKVGHVHLHVPNLDAALRFYRDDLGFEENLVMPQMGAADLHANGRFPHRLAINTWQGVGAPPPRPGTAGLRRFTIRYDSPARLDAALQRLPRAERVADGFLVRDPVGHTLLLTA
ncbi:VOC family protein [Deinococcus yavapaiensis]|uniref:Catechol 2,3-dioxygenase n=1 Tax=Deinococcus yavapaiensis KR-236 TaxID=694435 RepID=A0A318S299_9DEIO|nr:VOC family protein [Deinococcus yavapaiensis]PYE49499.1 catechol 2,3-dioxygenase [Deinococcus yavapaiensis KR-236]